MKELPDNKAQDGQITLVHGLGQARHLRSIPGLINRIRPEKPPTYLMSAAYLGPRQGLADIFGESSWHIGHSFHLDSGGYSLATGRIDVSKVCPKKIADAANRNAPQAVYCPDYPLGNNHDFERLIRMNQARYRDFFFRLKPSLKSNIFGISHAYTGLSSRKNLNSRIRWMEAMLNVPGARYDGFAVPVNPVSGLRSKLRAALAPWGFGFKKCHILGVASIKLLPLFAYLGRIAYSSISLDAKTFTIDAAAFPKFFIFPPGERLLKGISLTRKAFVIATRAHEDAVCACSCSICRVNQKIHGASLWDLSWRNLSHCKKSSRIMAYWLPVHNVMQAEDFIDSINRLTLAELRKLNKSLGHEEEIDLIDAQISAGSSSYRILIN